MVCYICLKCKEDSYGTTETPYCRNCKSRNVVTEEEYNKKFVNSTNSEDKE